MTSGTDHLAAAAADAGHPRTASRPGVELRRLLELFALCGFVVAQPLFEVAGRSPEFFLYRRAGATDILLLVALAVLGPPLVLWAGEALVGLAGRGLRRAAHLAVVAGLLLLLTVAVAKHLVAVRGVPLLLLGVAGGLAGAAVYSRSAAVRLWLRYATPAPLVFALLFLTVSPAGKLVVAGDQQVAATPIAASAGPRPPVVMLFLDELPLRSLLDSRGRIDRRLYPNFARFAGDATWYRNATGIAPFTPDAVPAMLTGRYPARGDVPPTYTEYPGNLFTLLAGSHDVQVSESVTQLCPPRLCPASTAGARRAAGWQALGRDLAAVWARIVSPRHVDEDPTAQFSEDTVGDRSRAAGATPAKPGPTFRFNQLRVDQPARFTDFLARLGASDRPTLDFLHLLLPHQPFKFLPSGARYTYPPIQFGYDRKKGWTNQPAPVALAARRHLLQLAYTDRLVGEVIQRLKDQGLYDKALVVITADHGNSFTSGHAQRLLQDGNAHELLWVPLFIKAPHQRTPRVDDRNWEHVDLLPTIADMLKVKVPWRVDGVSAMGPARSRRVKYFFNEPTERLEVDGPTNQALALRGITDRVAPPEDGMAGLFQPGPYADLIGRRPEAVGVAGGSGLVARLERHENERLKAVDPTTGIVPALVTGALTGPLPDAPVPLAVAVNGVVGAVGLTFSQDRTPQTFAMVVPDRLFRPGANRVRLYRVERTPAGTRLHPVELVG
jgi:Sulfatase